MRKLLGILAVVLATLAPASRASAAAASPQPIITEFLADNQGGLRDEDGNSSDWIELFNPGTLNLNLEGWAMTDDETHLVQWRFPSTNLPANAFLIVFASGLNRATPGAPLHTSFRLSKAGGYLALITPDGERLTSEFHYGPQHRNVSLGLGRRTAPEALNPTATALHVLVPTSGELGLSWTVPGFDDAAWITGAPGIGFDRSAASDGLLGWWNFDDASAPLRAPDASGHNHTGQILGATYTADRAGRSGSAGDRALSFTGNSVMRVPDAATGMLDSLVTNNAVTVSAWTYGAADLPLNTFLFWAGSNPDGSGTRELNAHLPWSDSVIYWDTAGCCDAGLHRVSISEPNPARWKGQWNHYAFVKNGDLKEIWQNGNLILRAVNSTPFTAARSLFLGAGDGNGSSGYHGLIDDFAVWDVALGTNDIGTLAAGGSPLAVRRFSRFVGTDVGGSMQGVNASAFVRMNFVVTDPAALDFLTLRLRYDDGFIAFLNGEEVARVNAPAAASWNSAASSARPSGAAFIPEDFDLSPWISRLRPGTNLLALHGMNASATNANFLLDPEILWGTVLSDRVFTTPSPGAPNDEGLSGFVAPLQFSTGRGFLSAPLDLTVWVPTEGATLALTTDGSEPSPTHGTIANGTNITVHLTNTTVLRAAAFREDLVSSGPDTQTYLFPASVGAQRRPASVPSTWPGGYPADFEMDPRVSNQALPGYRLTNALLAIPTVSVVTPEPGLFGAAGIYANSGPHGDASERPASIEWMYPDGRAGFQHDAGLRIHGNISRDKSFTPKHGFNVSFRGEYGPSTLDFPIFPDTPAIGFDRLVLRAGSTDTWPCVEWTTFIVDGVLRWYRAQSSYVRDQWVRDAQIALGQPSSHGTFAHLYLNGLYWGLYNVCERPDDQFAALHLGGAPSEYDVLADFAEVHAGTADAWNQLISASSADLSQAVNYQRLMGNNSSGTRNPALPVLLDVTNLVDYMILHIFIGADDWPDHNWWAARRQGPESTGFKFFAWDQEISINSIIKQHSSWGPLYAEAAAANTPSYVYSRCRSNAEFRMLFADRVQRHLFTGGALSVSNNITRWAARISEVDQAVVAESARWGDYQRPSQPYRREVEFLTNNLWMRNVYFPSNHTIALSRFRNAKLFPATAAPLLSRAGGIVPRDYSLSLTNPNAAGTIYFTTNGADPRVTGGGILAGATTYSNPIPLTAPTRVRARVRSGTEWSALADAMFYPEQDLTRLVVSEILYNPVGAPGVDGDAFEFLELKNVGDATIDLTGLRFDAGIDFTFSPGTRIAPGAFLVLGQNSTNFLARYPGVPLHGVYLGRLDNGGETLRLIDAVSNVVFSFRYDDTTGWPAAADGDGFSLVPRDPVATMTDAASPDHWRASTVSGGSPGVDDPEPTPPPVSIQAEGSGNSLHYLLIWSGGPMAVEHATSVAGPWLPLEAAGTSPYGVWPTSDTGFFRLRQR